ncbi:tetratricopeptide repeat protein [Brachyspira pulli]|uniref:tetratricopeptide repeat protein n=1 Tax=Brachyspira pulli TaxID=310721 RepID=UPI003005B97A
MESINYFFKKYIEKCQKRLKDISESIKDLKSKQFLDNANKYLENTKIENFKDLNDFYEFNKYIENLNKELENIISSISDASIIKEKEIRKLKKFDYRKLINNISKHSIKYYQILEKILDMSNEEFEKYKIELYKDRGDLKLDLYLYEDAAKDYKKAIELNPKFEEAKINLEIVNKKISESNSIKSFDEYYDEGVNAYNEKKYEDAIEIFSKAIEINATHVKSYLYRGVCELVSGKVEEAVKDFNKGIELDPNQAKFYFYRGNVKLAYNNIEEAIKDFDKAIELDPNYIKPYLYRGHAKLVLNRNEEAIQDFYKAIELDPNYAQAYYHRGLSKMALKNSNSEEVIEDFDKIIELHPNDPYIYFVRGNINKSLNRIEEAQKDFDKYREIEQKKE